MPKTFSIPKIIDHYFELDRAGQGYNKEVMPAITPIREFDLTLPEHREYLEKVFQGEIEALITIKGAPDYMIIPFKYKGIQYMRRSALMFDENGLRTSGVDPYEDTSPEEFFQALPEEQAHEFIFFLDRLITRGG